jgi:hypothetical protein
VDPDAASIHANETPEMTLDRTRHLLARSRQTLDAANKRLNKQDDQRESSPRRGRDSGS